MGAVGDGRPRAVILEVPGAWTAAVTAEEPADPTARTCMTTGLRSAGGC